jgi:hypothetical protein
VNLSGASDVKPPMKPDRQTILVGTLAFAVVAVAAIGVAMGLAGLQFRGGAAPRGEADADAPIRYTCSADHASFTAADMQAAPRADARDDTATRLLGMATEGWLPLGAWRRVVDSPHEVVFLSGAGLDGAPYAVVHVVPGDAGEFRLNDWAVDSYGACTPRAVVPVGTSVATWWADPAADPIGPESERIPALVLENACASGRTAEGRVLPPAITYDDNSVIITILVRSLGNAECPGHPFTPFIVGLDEPLGDRALLDGGQWPLADPLRPPEN